MTDDEAHDKIDKDFGDLIEPRKRSPVESGVSLRGPSIHYLAYSIHSNKVSWCPICHEHFYNERNQEHTTEPTLRHYHKMDEAS